MSVTLRDKTKAQLSWLDGRCHVEFKALARHRLVLPVGTTVTIELIDKLYSAFKGL